MGRRPCREFRCRSTRIIVRVAREADRVRTRASNQYFKGGTGMSSEAGAVLKVTGNRQRIQKRAGNPRNGFRGEEEGDRVLAAGGG